MWRGEPEWVEGEERAGADSLGLSAGERRGLSMGGGNREGEPKRGRSGRADLPAPVVSMRRGGGREVGVARRGVGGGGKGCAQERGSRCSPRGGEPEWVAGKGEGWYSGEEQKQNSESRLCVPQHRNTHAG